MNISNAIALLFLFNGLLLAFTQYKSVMRNTVTDLDSKLSLENHERKKRLEELKRLTNSEDDMKEKELAIVNLYEITRRMSASLRFNKIFEVFSSFSRENISFRKCDLLILAWDGDEPHIDRTYSVRRTDGDGLLSSEKIDGNKLVTLFLESPREVFISRAKNPDMFDKLKLTDKEIETLAAIPLLSERKLVAILAFVNAREEELEKTVILSIQFASELKKVLLYETVEQLAITDSLTGLYVRRYFSERLREELKRSKRYKFNFTFLMIDIDDFKKTNDTHGHLVGDAVLKELSRLLKESVREIDLAARYGGEEFAVMLPETGIDGARVVAERIRKNIEEHTFKAYDEKLKITVSLGISVYPKDAHDATALIEKADAALYEAKKSGKNVVCEYKK